MHSLPQEFLVLCRQLADAQQRCSATMAAQARQIETLTAEVMRLRGAVVLRDTRLSLAREEIEQLRTAAPGLSRRKAMALHIGVLAERIAALSRERLHWRQSCLAVASRGDSGTSALACGVSAASTAMGVQVPSRVSVLPPSLEPPLDVYFAAADLVICQTGCISHDQYWRVQDYCRRTGKRCILVHQPLAAPVPSISQAVVVSRKVCTPASMEAKGHASGAQKCGTGSAHAFSQSDDGGPMPI